MTLHNSVNFLRSINFRAGCILLSIAVAGCGGSSLGTVPGGGTVLMDGSPVEGATVVFSPSAGNGQACSGTTDASGVFKLTTAVNGDGVIPGSYKVAITKWDRPPSDLPVPASGDSKDMDAIYAAKEKRGNEPEAKNAIAPMYANPAGSGLNAEVSAAGPNDFKFEVKSK